MKRFFDLFWALFGTVLLSPALLLIALIIKLTDRGPIFFRQERIGRYGKPFCIWKFRTMIHNADSMGIPLTVGHDPRITKIGHWLRKTKLDELPQLFNILSGDMSFVGPRPEVSKYVAQYTESQRQVLELTPGLTDVASVEYSNESDLLADAEDPEQYYRDSIVPAKISMNLNYASQATIWTDFLVVLSTFTRLFGFNAPKCTTGNIAS